MSADAKPSPGPWKESEGTPLIIRDASDLPVCVVLVSGRNEVEAAANAQLIKAIPELIASLKEVMDWIAGGLQASREAWPDARCLEHTEEMAARARAAVDKAEAKS